jgi:hypothetical protein
MFSNISTDSHRNSLYNDMWILVIESFDDGFEAVLGAGGNGLNAVAQVDDEAPIFGCVLCISYSF